MMQRAEILLEIESQYPEARRDWMFFLADSRSYAREEGVQNSDGNILPSVGYFKELLQDEVRAGQIHTERVSIVVAATLEYHSKKLAQWRLEQEEKTQNLVGRLNRERKKKVQNEDITEISEVMSDFSGSKSLSTSGGDDSGFETRAFKISGGDDILEF